MTKGVNSIFKTEQVRDSEPSILVSFIIRINRACYTCRKLNRIEIRTNKHSKLTLTSLNSASEDRESEPNVVKYSLD